MNWKHLQAFIWLRWRLMANQWRRAGAFSAALMILIAFSIVATAAPLFFGCFALGVYLIPKATPDQLMYVWDALILAFLFFWAIGVITELQRNDPLALSKFLHLPVSISSAFLINYASSLLKLSLIFFVPAMAGYALALVYVRGIEQWAVVPSLVAFLAMVTALTYQFQGWLASLVSNPRRRRTVVVMVTMGFVLVAQLPNLINLYVPRMVNAKNERLVRQTAEMGKLQGAFNSQEIDNAEFTRRQQEINDKYKAESDRASAEESAKIAQTIRIVNMVVPAGWLPLAVVTSAEGRILPALLGLAGLAAISAASLARAYRSTIAQYQGRASSRATKVVATRPEAGATRKSNLLEAQIPGLSEPVSAIMLGGIQSLLRSPEAKIALLMPIIMGAVFGMTLFKTSPTMAEPLRLLIGIAMMLMVLFGLSGLMANQFGLERDGFRAYVLSAAPRRDILLGKNLSFAAPTLVLALILVGMLVVICPMRFDHALGLIPQFISMFLIACFVNNFCSIYAPVYLNPGTLKPTSPKMSTVLVQLLFLLFLFPFVEAFTLIPLGVESLLKAYNLAEGIPVCLLLTLAECALIVLLYHLMLSWQGGLLQAREQKILEKVTNRLA